MTIAITGGTGFVGQAVLDLAERQGRQVRALTRREQSGRTGVIWVRGDLSNTDALAELVRGAEAVVHIAGVVNAPGLDGFLAGNRDGTQAVVSAASDAGVQRFVHVSSLAAREPQLSDYGYSKQQAEAAVEASTLDWTMVRPPAIYGPRDTEVFELFKAARLGLVPMPPEGRASIVHVEDLARLLLLLAERPGDTSPRIMEPDDGRPGGWSHVELAKAIGKAMGKSVWAPNVPRAVLMAAARLDMLVRGKRAKLTLDRASYMSHPDWTSAPERLVPQDLWQAQIPTERGLCDTARWYRDHGWV